MGSGYTAAHPIGVLTESRTGTEQLNGDRFLRHMQKPPGRQKPVVVLHDAISNLEKRLEPVLTPVPPQPGMNQGAMAPGPITSQLRGRLATLNEGYGDAIRRLRDLALRIEV